MLRRLYLAGGFALLTVIAFAASWWLLHLRSQGVNDALDTLRRTEIATLQLRRREKDFLQRGEQRYVEDVGRERQQLQQELRRLGDRALLGAGELQEVEGHLKQYRQSFEELVASTRKIQELFVMLHGQGDRLAAELSASDADQRRRLAELRLFERVLVERGQRPDLQAFERGVRELMPAGEGVSEYAATFRALAREREILGLDENRGAHGRMRAAAHRLEARLGQLVVRTSDDLVAAQRQVKQAMLATSGLFLFTLALTLLYVRRLFEVQERLRSELAAREDEQRVILASIADGLITTNRHGKVTRMNPASELLCGWTEELARGKPIGEVFRIVNAKTREPAVVPVDTVLETGLVQGLANDTVLIARDGSERQIADSAAPLRHLPDGDVVGVVMVFRDVTERYEIEARQRQSQKLESIGLLAGGVAHDFNNMLAAILSASELLNDISTTAEQRELVDMVSSSARNAASLTTKLLSFSRQGKLVSSPLDVHKVLEDTLVIMSRTLDKRVAIVKDLLAPSAVVVGDPAQLQNTFLNLGINASDAMPQGGQLRISTNVVELDAAFCQASGFELSPGSYLELVFADDGVGMDEATRARIFDPFFTTKEHERGTGLGLASVYGAVKEHRGAIDVQSSPGGGSQFRILLPLADEQTTVPTPHPSAIVTGVTVLVVDDEQLVRTTVKMILQRAGHRVLEAENGTRALEIFRENAAAIALVVLDMVMPDLRGQDVARRLAELRPGVRILFMSGFTPDRVDLETDDGPRGFVHKPFGREEFLSAVARALASRTSA